MSLRKTRSSVRHGLLGDSLSELPLSELPTASQVAKHFLFLKYNKYSNNKEIIPIISQSLIKLWERAGIPPQTFKNVKRKISRLMEECSATTKHGRESQKAQRFEASLKKLFDIARCQCHDFEHCRCAREDKVPQRERSFLADQRSARIMSIGGIDQRVTGMMKRRQQREERNSELREAEKRLKEEDFHEEHTGVDPELEHVPNMDSTSESEECDMEDDGNKKPRNIVSIPTVALEADRFNVSNRATAAICTATLIDYGIVSPDDVTNVVDKQKVWRARQQIRNQLKESTSNEEDKIIGLFFDGKKDMTLTKQKIDGKWYSTTKLEDHYVIIGEPGTFYLRHVTVERGTGATIAAALHDVMKELGILENICAVGADSTAVNTGRIIYIVQSVQNKLYSPE